MRQTLNARLGLSQEKPTGYEENCRILRLIPKGGKLP